jgi:hypothetical protein
VRDEGDESRREQAVAFLFTPLMHYARYSLVILSIVCPFVCEKSCSLF